MFEKQEAFSVTLGITVIVLGVAVFCPAQTCVTDAGSDVRICVDWGEVADPVLNTDFTVDYTVDADNPDIKLISGSLSWQVWAEDKTNNALPANIGKIWADDAEDYVLFLAEPGVPFWTYGADNVGSIELEPTGDHFSSILNESLIAGDLTGDVRAVQDGGVGGGGGFWIGGDLSGTIDAVHGRGLTVVGEMSGSVKVEIVISGIMDFKGVVSGSVEVTDKLESGSLNFDKAVTSTATITINEMTTLTNQHTFVSFLLFNAVSGTMAGDLVLNSGIPAEPYPDDENRHYVKILGDFTSTASNNLKNQDVDGKLELLSGGAGVILNGGAISGILNLDDFSGTATVASLTSSADVDAGPLSGTLKVTGSTTTGGSIAVSGDLASAGEILVLGALFGDVTVTGDLVGDIRLGSAMGSASLIDVGGEVSATGRILIDGECDGDIIISERTADLSLIRLRDFGANGNIVVNDSEGDFHAEGDIYVGSVLVPQNPPPPDVTYDGSILLKKESGTSDGGGLLGRITVVGCHATTDDLDICECGTSPAINVTLTQPTCTNQVDWSCVSDNCPV